MLDADAVARYRREGFLAGRPILTAAEAAAYRAHCEASCASEVKDGRHRQASNRVKPYLLFDWAARLVRHAGVLDAVETLIGPDILVFHTTVWFKEPASENFVPWHQDATYFGLTPFEHVTAWVALTPSTPELGCVQVLPRSHVSGQRPHRDQPDPRAMLSRGQTLAEAVDERAAVDLVMAPGDVSFHHTLLWHRSGPNRGAARRIGIGISYIPASVRHVGPTRLSASLVRGSDRHGHFDSEPRPLGDGDPAAVAAHHDALSRFWRASEAIPEMALAH
jgi:ectoine hydroxylase-related dioxygenase (phytanoyl-CoA dioxygenase family)